MKFRPISEKLQEIASKELNEDSAKIEDDIKLLKEWLQKQPHLVARQDDQFLLNFLRGCKFSAQKAKQKLDYFYTAKAALPEYFGNRDPLSPEVQLILNSGAIVVLPKPLPTNGSRAIIYRWRFFNPNTMPFALLVKVSYMIIDVLMEEDDNAIIGGIHFLQDYKDFPGAYVTQFTPTTIQKANIGLQAAYPLRLKGLDFINVPNFFDTLYSIIKLVLSQKFKDRTKVYSENYAPSLYDRIPLEILPKEYGGSEVSVDKITEEWKRKLEDYAQWFKADEKYYCKEDLRPEDSKSDIFGADGTFRKLNLD